jgi:hypothetical protein
MLRVFCELQVAAWCEVRYLEYWYCSSENTCIEKWELISSTSTTTSSTNSARKDTSTGTSTSTTGTYW